jgi:hypothetical protein
MPSVTMKAGMPALAFSTPLMRPQKAPTARQVTIATGQGSPKEFTLSAPTTPDSASTEPSDRSMPAAAITKVAPKPRMPITAVASRMLRKFETLRK